jgi:hypothetical protein
MGARQRRLRYVVLASFASNHNECVECACSAVVRVQSIRSIGWASANHGCCNGALAPVALVPSQL